jgi:hypothetical protein
VRGYERIIKTGVGNQRVAKAKKGLRTEIKGFCQPGWLANPCKKV